jgi:branched-subunit amino acid transport protein
MNTAVLLAGMLVITFSIRYFFLAGDGEQSFPPWAERMLSFVPPAVLTAIVVPAILMPDGNVMRFHWDNPHLVGGAVALLVSALTKNLLITLLAAFAAFALWRFVLFP